MGCASCWRNNAYEQQVRRQKFAWSRLTIVLVDEHNAQFDLCLSLVTMEFNFRKIDAECFFYCYMCTNVILDQHAAPLRQSKSCVELLNRQMLMEIESKIIRREQKEKDQLSLRQQLVEETEDLV